MRLVLVVLLGACLQACSSFAFKNVQITPQSSAVQVIDTRPASEGQGTMFSWNSFSCAFGISRLADDKSTPGKMDVLRQRVFEKYGAGTVLKVRHFVVYSNQQASARGPFWGPLPYLIAGYAQKSGKDFGGDVDLYDLVRDVNCDPKESALGAYSWDEYPAASAMIVFLDIEVNNKRLMLRHVGEPTPETIDLAIKKTL